MLDKTMIDVKSPIAKHKNLALQNALNQQLLSEEKPFLALMHLDGIDNTVKELQGSFPPNFNHHFAVKANPYLAFLKVLSRSGMGAEVASAPELELALQAGFPTNKIIYDAPVKTRQEIDRVLSLNIALNIDNFEELERISLWMEENKSSSNIGFRINPQVGAGGVANTSTATLTSKFGIGLNDDNNRDRIIQACKTYPWINTIHVHVGSVACSLKLMCKGISAIVKLAEEIDQEIGLKQINTIDIGGGLPVDFTQDENNPTFKDYADFLRESLPSLFNGSYQVITEFGRAVAAKNAITIGRVEYCKTTGGLPIALTHIGVQTLVRTVYEPDDWIRRISAFTSSGELKTNNIVKQDIAGPACFSGDLIARKRAIPLLESGDYIMVHDTGAYHFSNHYQYNALPRLPVYGYRIDKTKNKLIFEVFSQGQSVNDVIKDYS